MKPTSVGSFQRWWHHGRGGATIWIPTGCLHCVCMPTYYRFMSFFYNTILMGIHALIIPNSSSTLRKISYKHTAAKKTCRLLPDAKLNRYPMITILALYEFKQEMISTIGSFIFLFFYSITFISTYLDYYNIDLKLLTQTWDTMKLTTPWQWNRRYYYGKGQDLNTTKAKKKTSSTNNSELSVTFKAGTGHGTVITTEVKRDSYERTTWVLTAVIFFFKQFQPSILDY